MLFRSHYLPYRTFVMKRFCDDLLNENKVVVCFHSVLSAVKTQNGKINSIEAVIFDRLVHFVPQVVIDCSGEGIVSALSGAPMIECDEYQAGAQVFSMENISEMDEAKLGMILIREVMHGIEKGELNNYFDRVTIVPGSLRNGSVTLKIGIPQTVTNEAKIGRAHV